MPMNIFENYITLKGTQSIFRLNIFFIVILRLLLFLHAMTQWRYMYNFARPCEQPNPLLQKPQFCRRNHLSHRNHRLVGKPSTLAETIVLQANPLTESTDWQVNPIPSPTPQFYRRTLSSLRNHRLVGEPSFLADTTVLQANRLLSPKPQVGRRTLYSRRNHSFIGEPSSPETTVLQANPLL